MADAVPAASAPGGKYANFPKKNDLLQRRLNKAGERKYFDSGDYAMCSAGKKADRPLGSQVPTPENLPHKHGLKHSSLANSSVLSGSTSEDLAVTAEEPATTTASDTTTAVQHDVPNTE